MADERNTTDPEHENSSSNAGIGVKLRRLLWAFPLAGLVSLIWFLVRVIPKPSRAAYPCQRAAAPLASSFVLWVLAFLVSMKAWRRGAGFLRQSRVRLAVLCLVLAATLGTGVFLTMPTPPAQADVIAPNRPIGEAKGIYPGRVVWAHDPQSTNWKGPGDGHWWEAEHTRQQVVHRMMSDTVQALSGKKSDKDAWDSIFRHFNRTRGGANAGYKSGEKIAIKINLVGAIFNKAGNVDPATYNMVRRNDYMNTSPQMMVAILRQLVQSAGVRQADISIGDPLTLFPNEYYEICSKEFPDVHYIDHNGGTSASPRTKVQPSQVAFYWSCRPEGKTQDYIPTAFAEAKYFINMANLKSHTLAGVTLCAKNYLGALIRTPPEAGYYNIHDTLTKNAQGYGKYRSLVDLMGHSQTGGKALIYFIDGLYAGVHPVEDFPKKWNSAPFNGNWSSSLFVSLDPVAIDSVGFDFLYAEWNDHPHMPGTDDYLHEAAQADNPPSGTFYDPDHPTAMARMKSLGVHEHWNNPTDRNYSRNLGSGSGIELIRVESSGAGHSRQ